MGVPAFFRWLSRKYPSVIIECVENKQIDPETGNNIYDDGSLPNPNGVEFDNLYLDMNGIIHPCTHPEDKPAPKNEDEMMVAIFDCIDRLVNIVRPRKLIYMAIDGVAPRAKMNQQRSRRFRAAKESAEKRQVIQRIREELEAKGCILPPEKKDSEHFDSNCITPGTPFMHRLSKCLNYYIHDRLNNNPAWQGGLKVILSDANVPGEGEHKIMDFIRKQRAQPDHDPNTKHVLCGADADLIMLGLATHEPHFTIIREEFLPNKPKPCDVCGQYGHELDNCNGLQSGADIDNFKPDVPIGNEVKFIFVRLNVLREYLKTTLSMPGLPFEYDFERALDDWVFMCFFVGNDFLPHLPSLEIREGAVDRLIELYKKCVYHTGGYLTDSGEVILERVQMILYDLGNMEDGIFKDRQRRDQQFKSNQRAKRIQALRQQYSASVLDNSDEFKLVALGKNNSNNGPPKMISNYKKEAANLRTSGNKRKMTEEFRRDNESPAAKMKREEIEVLVAAVEDEIDESAFDEVRLWEDGFKDRYYESKFDVTHDNLNFRYSVALQYVRGLCWVLKYYYQGCASWDWYFPYHYAPFASDFINITDLSTKFAPNTKPFNPLEQLMSVFPAASSSHLPESWAKLMTDPSSDIIDFYPDDFKIDLNGKKFAWQGVALLPFVDEKRLFNALKPYYKFLTEEELIRNKNGECRLYIGKDNKKFNFIQLQSKNGNLNAEKEMKIVIDGVSGTIMKSLENVPQQGTLSSPIANLHNITDNGVITVVFRDHSYEEGFIFPARRLPNAIDPPNVLAPSNKGQDYRPTIGFTKDLPKAYVSQSGHRLLNNSLGLPNGNNDQRYQLPAQNNYTDYRNLPNMGQQHYQPNRNHSSVRGTGPSHYVNNNQQTRYHSQGPQGGNYIWQQQQQQHQQLLHRPQFSGRQHNSYQNRFNNQQQHQQQRQQYNQYNARQTSDRYNAPRFNNAHRSNHHQHYNNNSSRRH